MKIVAIGGGEIGRPGTQIETESIDREVIKLSGKAKPKLLFIPTASNDSEGYCEVVKGYYGNRLGCEVDFLRVASSNVGVKELRSKVLGSDIIYVGGGNTAFMLDRWEFCGLDKILKEAAERGIVLSGVSAGAMCWFEQGLSDSLRKKEGSLAVDASKPLVKIDALSLIPNLLFCPHYDAEEVRKPALYKLVAEEGIIAIALTNCAAMEIVDNKYRIIRSSDNANAFRVYKHKGKVVEKSLQSDWKYRPLKELLGK